METLGAGPKDESDEIAQPIEVRGIIVSMEATMGFSKEDIQANRNYFLEKLRSEKQRNDVLKAVEGNLPFDFVLLDTRGREAFVNGHIPGAWSAGEGELDQVLAALAKDREIVTYCWGHD